MSITFDFGKLTVSDIAKMTSGELICINCDRDEAVVSYCTDSREAVKGSLFVAIAGERVDGHDYINAAVKNGASCILCERVPEGVEKESKSFAFVVVKNTVLAVGALAHEYKKMTEHKTVAITGSVGKTTTKEFVYAVLSEKYKTHRSGGNHNNELGLPMSVFEMKKDDEVAILEMGMCNFGEIEYLSKIAEPDVALVTTIGSSHLENLGSRENICSAKLEIVKGLKKGGTLILNGDEPLLSVMKGSHYSPVFVALENPEAEFRAVNIRYFDMKTVFDVIYDNRVVTNVEIMAMGAHSVYAALFGYAVGVTLGMDDGAIRRGLQKFKNAAMRQNIYDLGEITVIEDCYNASPESMAAALGVLHDLSALHPASRAVALLGDMRELGENTVALHKKTGACAHSKGVDALFTFGELAENIARGAIESGMGAENVFVNTDQSNPEYTAKALLEYLKPGDILLVKASRAVAAERVIEYIKTKIK